ncbi:MAG: glycosyltransferase family 2 protein [Burkholderiales bacterium]|jgi:rhamnosyltransferase|nr:glycosyltransferase family 2 protein [Burkholderiales bacterium]
MEIDSASNPVAGARICAVCVTYNPSRSVFEKVLDATIGQVAALVVVDNGSAQELQEWLGRLSESRGFCLLRLKTNLGIAAALNRGVEAAKKQRCEGVLLLDHDSMPSTDMVAKLLEATVELQAAGHKIGVVGPQCVDISTGRSAPFVRLGWSGFKQQACAGSVRLPRVDLLITSGSFIWTKVLDDVGGMDEALFIDHVDTEWCLRARAAGYAHFGVCHALLMHSLGEGCRTVWWFRRRVVHLHSSARIYYYVRNGILLMSKSVVPWSWRVAETIRTMSLIVFYLTVASPRMEYARMIARGLLDGFRGISGAMSVDTSKG